MPIKYSLSEKQKESILINSWYLCDLLNYYIDKYEEEKYKKASKEDALDSYNKIKDVFEDKEDEVPHKPTQAEIEEFWADMNEDSCKNFFMGEKNNE